MTGRDLLEYIPLNAVLSRVYPLVPKEYANEDKLLEWASEAMESLATYKTYEKHLCFQRVDNYKTPIPTGMYALDMMLYYQENADENFDEDLCAPLIKQTPEDDGPQTDFLCYDRRFIRNLWQPLVPSSTNFDLSVLCKDSALLKDTTFDGRLTHRCEHKFIVDARSKMFVTTFEKGWVAIAHIRTPMDGDKFLIPNVEHLKSAIETYCLWKVWEWRMNTSGEKKEMKMYNLYAQKYQMLSMKSVGEQMMPSQSEHMNLHNLNKMVREDGRFQAGLGNLGFSESIQFGI